MAQPWTQDLGPMRAQTLFGGGWSVRGKSVKGIRSFCCFCDEGALFIIPDTRTDHLHDADDGELTDRPPLRRRLQGQAHQQIMAPAPRGAHQASQPSVPHAIPLLMSFVCASLIASYYLWNGPESPYVPPHHDFRRWYSKMAFACVRDVHELEKGIMSVCPEWRRASEFPLTCSSFLPAGGS